MKRILTAAVGVPALVGLLFWGPPLAVRGAFTFVALLCLSEFLKLAAHYGAEPMRLAGYLAAAWIVSAPTPPAPLFFLGVTLLLMTLGMRGGREPSATLTSAAATLLGIIYTGIPLRLASDLQALNPHWVAFTLVVNWLGDAAAYYAGRAFGRRQLAPQISPAKTWEGAAASLVVGTAAGAVYLRIFLPQALPAAAALSLAVNVAAQAGDLAESALKRGAGIKDSGALLPGHGGFLDRLDGVLFSLPVVYWAAAR